MSKVLEEIKQAVEQYTQMSFKEFERALAIGKSTNTYVHSATVKMIDALIHLEKCVIDVLVQGETVDDCVDIGKYLAEVLSECTAMMPRPAVITHHIKTSYVSVLAEKRYAEMIEERKFENLKIAENNISK
jgi:hypothetical protein